jgi:hypothetical protein
MPKARLKKERTKDHPLAGSWVSGTEFGSEIEYIVTPHASDFKVRAIDRYDNEVADVFEINWDGQVLSFATYWNSTGRFLRCRLQAVGRDEVEYTYTYTAQETWHRKKRVKKA